MRATQHCGRTRSNGTTLGTRHNDRQFDTSKADNIRENPEHENQYYAHTVDGWINDGSVTFDEAERGFYERFFQKDLDMQNERAIKARHKERVQDIDQYRQSRKHCPEEVILQIGSVKDGTVSEDVFIDCAKEYVNALKNESGNRCCVLNVAFHFDEAVPHAHIRRVWAYKDEKQQILRIGQEKALEQAGFVPYCLREGQEDNPKYCNRKIAFDSYMRDIWLDICEQHGIEVEREPIPDGHHNRSKEELIADQYRDALDIIAHAEHIRETLQNNILQGLYSVEERKQARKWIDQLDDDLSL